MRRRLLILLLVPLALLLLAGILVLGAWRTEAGARALWQAAMHLAPGTLSGELAGGTLSDGLQLRNLAYRDKAREVKVDRLDARWHWSFSPRELDIGELRIGTLEFTALPTPKEPASLPRQIALPLAIELRNATLRKLLVHRTESAMEIGNIVLAARSDGMHHALTLEHAETPYGAATAHLQLDGRRPFPLSGAADLHGTWRNEAYRIDAALSGTLQALDMQLKAAGGQLSGQAHVEATPYAAVPLRRAQVTVRELDLRMLNPAAPEAALDIDATLAPVDGEAQAEASSLALAGPVSIRNTQPGALDHGLLPLVSAQAEVRLDAQQQQLQQLQARLAGGATLEGSGELHGGTGRLSVQAKALDLHALHGKLKPTRLDGPLDIALADGTQHIVLALKDSALAVHADARIDAAKITLKEALLQAGAARLRVAGALARDTARAYEVHGSLDDFNPALFFKDKAAEARINMDFDARGVLQPEPAAQLQFDIRDSSYAGLPMTGGGKLHWSGRQVLASDVQLLIAANRLRLAGSFGTPGERLKFDIDAPALARLGFGLSGLLQANGELGGSVERPAVNATFRAEQLTFRQYRISHLSGQADTRGVPGRQPDAKVTLKLDANGVQADDINLAALHAAVDGSYAEHKASLDTRGQVRGKPLALTLSAHGRLQEQPQGYAWDGTLNTLESRGFPRLALAEPLTVSVAPQRLVLGATRLTLEQARIELKSFRLDGKTLASEGAVNALDVRRLLELRREITGAEPPLATDLVLDGSWNFSLAESAAGYFQVERRSGDARVLSGARENPLGLTALRLRGDLQGSQLSLDARIEASRFGSASAAGRIALQPVDGRLMPARGSTVDGRITGTVPRLQRIAAMAGPSIALDGSVDIDMAVNGTLAEPKVSGDATGSKLALMLYDQGVRLHDGSAQLRLDNNIVEIRQLLFHGGDGTLRANGSIALDRASPDLSATIVADHLQLLANPARQLSVSGQAVAKNVDGLPTIAGNFTVDRARFQLPEKSAPALDDDVVVIRGKERVAMKSNASRQAAQAGSKAAGPFTPAISIEIGLGDDFRFEGSGAALLLAGNLTVKSAPGEQPQAFGTVRIVEGTYETFGTKLAIEHGVINFQGPLANPNINILAMRRNQDVAAGVQVTGNVRQPRVQLVSEPDLPEQEKLNWLVFGRAGDSADAGSGQAQAAAKEAALGLLNRFGGNRIAKGFGLDQLAIGSSAFGLGTQQVVSFGKEVSDRLFIGYEQSLTGAEGVLKLTYELSRHWSVVVRGGAIGGLDVFYSKRFDAPGDLSEGR